MLRLSDSGRRCHDASSIKTNAPATDRKSTSDPTKGSLMQIQRKKTSPQEQPHDWNARYHQLETVQAISQSILETTDITHILDELLEKTIAIGEFDLGNIRLFDTSGRIAAAAYQGYRNPETARRRHHKRTEDTGKSMALREVIDSGKVLVSEDILAEGRMRGFGAEGARSVIAVPLAAREEIYGVIAVATRSRRHFAPAEIRLVERIGAEIGMGVQKSRLLEETQRQAGKLQAANKLHADFSAMIAHDLRSPLYTIIGVAEMMRDGLFGPLNENQKNWLDRVKNNGAGLINLVSDFLDVSKLESGHIELAQSDIDILDLIQNTMQNFTPLAASKNVRLICAVVESIPSIRADRRRIDQVLANLVSNAIKFTGAGGAVEVRVCTDDENLSVQVKDNGVGIPRDEIETLFQKYRQAKNLTVPTQKGTGLGLVICKMIVEAHGGRIWVDSDEGKGTVFTFTLPFDISTASEDEDYFFAPNR
jgi:signal transduction histidine kinase